MIFVFLFHRFSYISCINFRCLLLKAQLDLIRLFYCTAGCSVGYFAYAQYDVLFIPYRHFVPLSTLFYPISSATPTLPPEGGSEIIFGNSAPKEEAGIVFGNSAQKVEARLILRKD